MAANKLRSLMETGAQGVAGPVDGEEASDC